MSFIRSLYISVLAILGSVFGGEGAALGYTGFFIPSILMGLGVAIDVLLATLVKFNDRTLSWKNWTLPVTFTHTLFPAVGYFLFWSAASSFPAIKTLLGVIGFSLVALFIYEVLCESTGRKPVFGISSWLGGVFGFQEDDAKILVAVLAVSWDALWSGPAKAAQATAGSWSSTEVALSFLIAGLVVAITAELALLVADRLRKKDFKNTSSLARFNFFGTYLELSVIGGFGILSLWHVFSDEANLYTAIMIAAGILLVAFLALSRSLFQTELQEVTEAVQ